MGTVAPVQLMVGAGLLVGFGSRIVGLELARVGKGRFGWAEKLVAASR